MDARRLEMVLDNAEGGRFGLREEAALSTYRSDPASGRDGADGASGLADSVAQHIKGGI
jgi:hypothetical protein